MSDCSELAQHVVPKVFVIEGELASLLFAVDESAIITAIVRSVGLNLEVSGSARVHGQVVGELVWASLIQLLPELRALGSIASATAVLNVNVSCTVS